MRVYYDLHIHSCLSPCGDEDMTPNNIVNMSALSELGAIALSDHNTTGNVDAFLKVAEQVGVVAFPAMELETAEEIHVLCLFYDAESAHAFDREVVAPALPPIKNRVDIFGPQHLMNENDEIIGSEERYLINATDITVDRLPELVWQYGGIAVPAHIDKSTKSILSVLGWIDSEMGYKIFELSSNAPADFIERHPELADCFFLYDSDSHYLQDVGEQGGNNYFDLPNGDKNTIWNYLKSKM